MWLKEISIANYNPGISKNHVNFTFLLSRYKAVCQSGEFVKNIISCDRAFLLKFANFVPLFHAQSRADFNASLCMPNRRSSFASSWSSCALSGWSSDAARIFLKGKGAVASSCSRDCSLIFPWPKTEAVPYSNLFCIGTHPPLALFPIQTQPYHRPFRPFLNPTISPPDQSLRLP